MCFVVQIGWKKYYRPADWVWAVLHGMRTQCSEKQQPFYFPNWGRYFQTVDKHIRSQMLCGTDVTCPQQQHHQQWLTSSLSVSLSTERCWYEWLKQQSWYGEVPPISWTTCCSVFPDETRHLWKSLELSRQHPGTRVEPAVFQLLYVEVRLILAVTETLRSIRSKHYC